MAVMGQEQTIKASWCPQASKRAWSGDAPIRVRKTFDEWVRAPGLFVPAIRGLFEAPKEFRKRWGDLCRLDVGCQDSEGIEHSIGPCFA